MILTFLNLITRAQCNPTTQSLIQSPFIAVVIVARASLTFQAFAGICACMSQPQQVLAILALLAQTLFILKHSLTPASPIRLKKLPSPHPILVLAQTKYFIAPIVAKALRKKGTSCNMVLYTRQPAHMAAPPALGLLIVESH